MRTQMSNRDQLQQAYNKARGNLLLVIILTAVNIVLFFLGSESMMLFSASVPFYGVVFGYYMGLTVPAVILAVIILALYLVCWLQSKKKSGWMTVALVLFILDTLVMAGMYLLIEDASGFLDVLIHAWVLYYLILAISTGKKLKNLPEEEEVEELPADDHSQPIRRVAEDEKFRVLLESEYAGRKVTYRRVKRTNQLVIDSHIYDELEMLVETAHCLYATIDGHTYEVGYDGQTRSYFKVDGELVAKKIRWY